MVPWLIPQRQICVVHKVEVPGDFLEPFPGDPGYNKGVVELVIIGPVISDFWQLIHHHVSSNSSMLVSHVELVVLFSTASDYAANWFVFLTNRKDFGNRLRISASKKYENISSGSLLVAT